jgi:hypothetical protein
MKGSVGNVDHSNPNTGQMLAAAFGQNQTLLDLELSVGQSPDVDIPVIELILSDLASNLSNLRVLRLAAGSRATLSQFEGLSRLNT